jgi:hypothetical protein
MLSFIAFVGSVAILIGAISAACLAYSAAGLIE